MSLRLRPWAMKHAIPFVQETHRRLKDRKAALFSVRVMNGKDIVGAAVVGRASARLLDNDYSTLEVLRCAVVSGFPGKPPLYPNACSMLYGACSRMAQGAGADNLVTYTHLDENGASLRASGWICDFETDGGEWSREKRPRGLAVDPMPKRRWWAPWSARVTQ